MCQAALHINPKPSVHKACTKGDLKGFNDVCLPACMGEPLKGNSYHACKAFWKAPRPNNQLPWCRRGYDQTYERVKGDIEKLAITLTRDRFLGAEDVAVDEPNDESLNVPKEVIIEKEEVEENVAVLLDAKETSNIGIEGIEEGVPIAEGINEDYLLTHEAEATKEMKAGVNVVIKPQEDTKASEEIDAKVEEIKEAVEEKITSEETDTILSKDMVLDEPPSENASIVEDVAQADETSEGNTDSHNMVETRYEF